MVLNITQRHSIPGIYHPSHSMRQILTTVNSEQPHAFPKSLLVPLVAPSHMLQALCQKHHTLGKGDIVATKAFSPCFSDLICGFVQIHRIIGYQS